MSSLFIKRVRIVIRIPYKNKEDRFIRDKQWYQENREHILLLRREFYLKNLEKVRTRNKNYNRKLKIELLNILGGPKCSKCRFSDTRALEFDHINNDGKIDRLRWKTYGTYRFILYYVKRPEEAKAKLQVLCANCNRIKSLT